MLYSLFTDPHLGTRRAAHTTRESANKLQQALYDAAMDVARVPDAVTVCLGDLFNRSQNPESVLVQGYNVASLCKWTLAGNHDSSNRSDTVTSLDALKEMGVPIVSAPDMSKPYFMSDDALYFVPHHASQELFETAMFHAAEHAIHHRDGLPSVLMLHCNYDCQFDIEDDTLNLSVEVADRLLNAFDYIFLGHEHHPNTHLDGRVVVLGNTHPTSFNDISDKYRYELEITDDSIELTPVMIWDDNDGYRALEFGKPIPDLEGVQFVDVMGVEAAGSGPAVAQYVQEVWAAGPDLLAVRNNVKIGDHLADVGEIDAPQLTDLSQVIRKDLEGTDMAPLYNELVKEVEA